MEPMDRQGLLHAVCEERTKRLVLDKHITIHYVKKNNIEDIYDIFLYDWLDSSSMLCEGTGHLNGYITNKPEHVTCQSCNEWLHA